MLILPVQLLLRFTDMVLRMFSVNSCTTSDSILIMTLYGYDWVSNPRLQRWIRHTWWMPYFQQSNNDIAPSLSLPWLERSAIATMVTVSGGSPSWIDFPSNLQSLKHG